MKNFYFFITNLIIAIFIAGSVYADTTYVIKRGDNPSRLAKKFKVSPLEIIKANNLNPDRLKPGTKITIPSKKRKTPSKDKLVQTNGDELKKEQDTRNSPDNIQPVIHQEDSSLHVVKKGDTLSSLARKYSVSMNELRKVNNLRSKKLRIGQKLVVKKTTLREYTVKKGDTVWKIARRFNLDPDELMDINLIDTDSLKPGQKLLLVPETEGKEPKTYDAILTQAHIESEIEKISGSGEINGLGLQDRLTLFAKKLLNIPYRFGGNSVFGIDCSAYVKRVYSLIGIDLPRSAREQFQEGKPVDGEELSIGDLVFFKTYASFPSHVGIYLGNNLFIHASSRSKRVTIDSLETPYYLKRFIGAKRLLDVKDEKRDPQNEG